MTDKTTDLFKWMDIHRSGFLHDAVACVAAHTIRKVTDSISGELHLVPKYNIIHDYIKKFSFLIK